MKKNIFKLRCDMAKLKFLLSQLDIDLQFELYEFLKTICENQLKQNIGEK